MKNLADAIENFIISELLRDSEDTLLVQRNELAEKLSCAPSQISYVLGTRFTPERGFMVESRRGSGGFVRIVRVAPARQRPEREPTAVEILRHLAAQRLVTGREARLLHYMLELVSTGENDKKAVLRQAIARLNGSGGGERDVM